MDLAVELPGSPLEAVMSLEVWQQVYRRLAELIEAHRTTLVFVNTRRLAERVTHQLCGLLGEDKVTSHHGSLSAKLRLEAEDRLKRGELKALVATASLELGIDIGSVDLVCQLGSVRSISTLLQRVGRADHRLAGLPKGRLFPLTRDELVETAAVLRCLRRGELDALRIPEKPLDILAQQIVACAGCEEWQEERLFEMVRCAWPYRNLTREEFDEVIQMLAEGFSTRRGRRGALIHHDAVNRRIRGRRGARLTATTCGGAIPDNADHRVVLEPSETFIGTVNEDFAIESLPGDIFLLGNASWKILRVNSGVVRVEDAHGQPPGIPFWLGEAPARSAELSRAVSELRSETEGLLQSRSAVNSANPLTPGLSPKERENRRQLVGETGVIETSEARALLSHEPERRPPARRGAAATLERAVPEAGAPMLWFGGSGCAKNSGSSLPEGEGLASNVSNTYELGAASPSPRTLDDWFVHETGLSLAAAVQLAEYFAAAHKALGCLPSQSKLVMERFFDESGGMQLVIHSLFGARINRAWGLALRKRFCRKFNFELQAAATDDALVLSLGTQHSFPLDEVFRYLNPNTVREVLVQALLDAPMFTIRWRWNTTRALAVLRQKGGRKNPAPLQRMDAENLLAAVFPDQLACLENIVGDREVPDHPLVRQTIDDCLSEAMDIDGLIAVLRAIEEGSIECLTLDLPEPSPLAHEILNARPYAFLDNAPLEERRTQAVYTRRALDSAPDSELGVLDATAIARVVTEAWPTASNADELHDALLMIGEMTDEEVARTAFEASVLLAELVSSGRIGRFFSSYPDPLPKERDLQRARCPSSNDREITDGLTTILPLPGGEGEGSARPQDAEPSSKSDDQSQIPSQPSYCFWLAAERLPMLRAIYPDAVVEPELRPPEREQARQWERADAVRELIRGRMEAIGPTTANSLVESLSLPLSGIENALLALEREGFILRGKFHPNTQTLEWCDRRLLARIHRLTINRLRAEIQPVSVANFCRFLAAWQRLDEEHRAEGPEGCAAILEQFDGFELPAAAWEPAVLSARVKEYDPHWLDRLCLTGRIGWGRLTPPQNQNSRPFAPLRTSPIALWQRESLPLWLALGAMAVPREFCPDTQRVFETLKATGAVFFAELVRTTGLLPSVVEQALGELVAGGWVTADSFDGLRAMLIPSEKRQRFSATEFTSITGSRRHKPLT
ncbi:MAG: ATP-dependent DNA helicase, partial [Verrucomicrobia bacterium]